MNDEQPESKIYHADTSAVSFDTMKYMYSGWCYIDGIYINTEYE